MAWILHYPENKSEIIEKELNSLVDVSILDQSYKMCLVNGPFKTIKNIKTIIPEVKIVEEIYLPLI